jgi:endo-1,3-1,4-beta-glycanase ExoK
MGVGAYRVALAEAAAEEAKSIASQEHPTQQEAIEAAVAVSTVAPVEPAPAEEPAPAAAAATPGPRLPQMGKAFIERFEGDQLDEGRWYISDGWSNGDWMETAWRRSQISITREGLRLTVSRAPDGAEKALAGGEIQSHAAFRYGYFEFRMRVPHDQGLITGAFTYAGREGQKAPEEIDIEILGKATKRVEVTIHENYRSTSKKADLAFDSSDGFHTYAFDWQADRVRWYVDGAMIHEEKGRAPANLTRPQKIMLTQWATKELRAWAGEVDPSRGPWMLDIACIAYAPKYDGKPLC